jgi:hypothetical protein
MTRPIENDFYDDEEEELVSNQKRPYRLVRLADDESSVASSNSTEEPKWKPQQFLRRNLIPDQAFCIRGIRILDGVEAVRFLKFVTITFLGMMLIHWFVALMVGTPQGMNRVCLTHGRTSLTFVS